MAFNGSGTYALYTPGNPVVSGTTIDSSWGNNTMNDIATALSLCVLKDGQQTTTASIPFVLGIAVTTAITTPSTGFTLLNATATTINAFGAATTLNMGVTGGTTTIGGTVQTGTGSNDVLVVRGSYSCDAASRVLLSYRSDIGELWVQGPNATTAPAFDIILSESDGGGIIRPLRSSNAGVITIPNLAGAGSRTVVADANGVLSAP